MRRAEDDDDDVMIGDYSDDGDDDADQGEEGTHNLEENLADEDDLTEKMEYEESIKKDLETLGIVPDSVSHTSDHFDFLLEKLRELIMKGKAYVDGTAVELMREQRIKKIK